MSADVIDLKKVREQKQVDRIAQKILDAAAEQCNDQDEFWEFMGLPPVEAYCPQCAAPSFSSMGQLGTLMHHRCQQCGWVFATETGEGES